MTLCFYELSDRGAPQTAEQQLEELLGLEGGMRIVGATRLRHAPNTYETISAEELISLYRGEDFQ